MNEHIKKTGKTIYGFFDILWCLLQEYWAYLLFIIIETSCFMLQTIENQSNRLIELQTPFFSYIHNPIYFIIGMGVILIFFAGFKQGNRYGI